MGYYEFPHTRNYDTDLGYLIDWFKTNKNKIEENTAITIEKALTATEEAIKAYNSATSASNSATSASNSAELALELKNQTEALKNLMQDKIDQINTNTSRINNLATIDQGSITTTADAELVDIRVGYNSTTYPSAGDAVRGQMSELNVRRNLVDTKKSVMGFLLSDDGTIQESSDYKTTDFIKVSPNQKVYITPRIRKLLQYTLNKQPITGTLFDSTEAFIFNDNLTLDEERYIRFSYFSDDERDIIAQYTQNNEYVPYGNNLINISTINGEQYPYNLLFNKTIYGFGDSLCYGHYSGKGFLDGIVEENNMRFGKYAVNGARVIQDLYGQIDRAPQGSPDFVIFDGLTNDAIEGVNVGEVSASYNSELFDYNTFCGAFERCIDLLRSKYMNACIIYVCPHNMPTRDASIQKALQESARKCCEKWAIPYVDIYRHGSINTNIVNLRLNYSYDNEGETSGGNGTHLTETGYNKFYKPMIVAKMKECYSFN